MAANMVYGQSWWAEEQARQLEFVFVSSRDYKVFEEEKVVITCDPGSTALYPIWTGQKSQERGKKDISEEVVIIVRREKDRCDGSRTWGSHSNLTSKMGMCVIIVSGIWGLAGLGKLILKGHHRDICCFSSWNPFLLDPLWPSLFLGSWAAVSFSISGPQGAGLMGQFSQD